MPWSPGEEQALRDAVRRGLYLEELGGLFPERSRDSINGMVDRIGLRNELRSAREQRGLGNIRPPENAPPVQPVMASPPCRDATEQLHAIPDLGICQKPPRSQLEWIDMADERTKDHHWKDETDHKRVTIDTDNPVSVMFSGDAHFGGLDIDYAAQREHLRFLFKVAGMYLVTCGDEIDLMVTHRVAAARFGCVTTEEQIEYRRRSICEQVERHKLLAVAGGNHDDEFIERQAGFSLTKMLCEGQVPYFRGVGKLDLTVGSQTYRIGLVHKTRFHSFMNPTHGNKRLLQMFLEFFGYNWGPPDVIVTAHHHSPGLTVEGMIPEARTWLVKVGTYKTNDPHSQRYYGQGRIGVPTMTFHPDRHEVVGMPTPFEAYRYMNGQDWHPEGVTA